MRMRVISELLQQNYWQILSGLNYTHGDSEFQAFETGAGVKPYPMFQSGPQGYQQLDDYIHKAYPNADKLEWNPAEVPQE